MADLQVYQYDSTKLPYESKTYTTPDMGDLYRHLRRISRVNGLLTATCRWLI